MAVEIQLGHLCNNRCVFCISGQLTALGRAPLLKSEPVFEQIRAAREQGHTRITFLGGEPTIQPIFLDVVRHAVQLRFDEIVIFSNGSRAGTSELIEDVIATGGRFEWRFSVQGATEEAHERTTRREGSFARLMQSIERARELSQRVTVNTCIVKQNFESLPHFADLLVPRGVSQLHVDMFHPLDTGEHTDAELREIMPRYSDLAEPLRTMIRGFGQGFDVNIGNLPHCIAPDLARWIRHGGASTQTITANVEGRAALNDSWNKYEKKQQHKVKPETCRKCVFDGRCSGVFELYRDFYGLEELVPVTEERLRELDSDRRMPALLLRPHILRALEGWCVPAPFVHAELREIGDEELSLSLSGPDVMLAIALRAASAEGVAATDRCALAILEARAERAILRDALRAVWERLCSISANIRHPLGDDALDTVEGPVGRLLARLRAAAPFSSLRWHDLGITDGRVELTLSSPSEERAIVWLEPRGAQAGGGYRLENVSTPSPELLEGLREVMFVLRSAPRSSNAIDARRE